MWGGGVESGSLNSVENRGITAIIFRAICVMRGTTEAPVFALEIERSKNNTNHIMKGQMDLI